MLGLSGLELLELIKERAPDIDVVLMTAFEDMPTVARAMREGASDFLVKPLELSKLRELILRVERDGRGRDEAAARSSPATGSAPLLVGRSPEILEVYKLIGRVAASRVTALIRGETGTGKELVARAIHESSAYAEEPFVPVNCTALPGTLLESELFGHVKGAFTGATSHRRGRFAMAQKGTIFLDEIGDTSPAFQSKLLRVLEDRIFVPVGAEEPQRTDARVLAATHRDLEALVARGSFREDLYYRLRVVELRVPPLRERLTDLPLLAQHFIQKASEALGCPQPELTDDATRHLLSHRWSGNVRELENCITLAATLADGGHHPAGASRTPSHSCGVGAPRPPSRSCRPGSQGGRRHEFPDVGRGRTAPPRKGSDSCRGQQDPGGGALRRLEAPPVSNAQAPGGGSVVRRPSLPRTLRVRLILVLLLGGLLPLGSAGAYRPPTCAMGASRISVRSCNFMTRAEKPIQILTGTCARLDCQRRNVLSLNPFFEA